MSRATEVPLHLVEALYLPMLLEHVEAAAFEQRLEHLAESFTWHGVETEVGHHIRVHIDVVDPLLVGRYGEAAHGQFPWGGGCSIAAEPATGRCLA